MPLRHIWIMDASVYIICPLTLVANTTYLSPSVQHWGQMGHWANQIIHGMESDLNYQYVLGSIQFSEFKDMDCQF